MLDNNETVDTIDNTSVDLPDNMTLEDLLNIDDEQYQEYG